MIQTPTTRELRRHANEMRLARERALYHKLQFEGARLTPLPAGTWGISASEAFSFDGFMVESLDPRHPDRNRVAFFNELRRTRAFHEPMASRRLLNNERRLAKCMECHRI